MTPPTPESSLFSCIPLRRKPAHVLHYLASFGLVGVAALVAETSTKLTTAPSLTLVFLIAVVISARSYGLWPAVFASVLSVLCWDFFFTLPYYSLFMSDSRDVVALIVFLIVSLVIGGMTAQIRRQNERLASLAGSTTDLYRLSQEISRLATVDEIASFTAARIRSMMNGQSVVVLRGHDDPSHLVFPADIVLDDAEIAAVDRIVSSSSDEHRSKGTPHGRYVFLPLAAPRGPIGSVGISRPDLPEFSDDERRKLDALMNQVAIAIERAWLAHDIEHAKMVADSERLRNALLTSVSHDLRTPLTTIIGALSTLEDSGASFDASIRAELVVTARSEAERLNRFVGNLLDVTRLESGHLHARSVPTDVLDVVESAVERAKALLANHVVEVSLPDDIPPASADFSMLEQVLFNLLDNAAKYSAPHTKIQIRGRALGDVVVIEICDRGGGIPEHAQGRVFDKFSRFAQGDSVPPGTGLGLTISRGFLASMDATITADNRSDGQGAIFTIRLKRASAA